MTYLVAILTCATTASGQFNRSNPKADKARWQAELELARKVREGILQRVKENGSEEFTPYRERVFGKRLRAGAGFADFDLVPIPAGRFTMGSRDGAAGRRADEGPRHEVRLDAFWMGRTEVTWNEFEIFMHQKVVTNNSDQLLPDVIKRNRRAAAIAYPSMPYVELSFGMGTEGYPAISMTQYAARKYTQWLSAKTGRFYRLPTEPEWEYACRAGTQTAYHFGDDPKKLGEYAWYEDNSDFKYQRVGTKKPNPWGLHDMHGNVAEWCLDQYTADYYSKFANAVGVNPLNRPVEVYPRVVRGGSWDDPSDRLRATARRASHPDWKIQDPQIPRSSWSHTDAQFLGMRVVRPLKLPSLEEMTRYWSGGKNVDVPKLLRK
ncbi:MAG: sulfatase-modifying factor protein [Verrucomicrobiales bacterium]|nr:sulfatase-modifying factor protein [Verrucomicrobiales bacterium]